MLEADRGRKAPVTGRAWPRCGLPLRRRRRGLVVGYRSCRNGVALGAATCRGESRRGRGPRSPGGSPTKTGLDRAPHLVSRDLPESRAVQADAPDEPDGTAEHPIGEPRLDERGVRRLPGCGGLAHQYRERRDESAARWIRRQAQDQQVGGHCQVLARYRPVRRQCAAGRGCAATPAAPRRNTGSELNELAAQSLPGQVRGLALESLRTGGSGEEKPRPRTVAVWVAVAGFDV